ncbi:MAG: hypothetical protein IKR90_01130, partial [Clostridia bacterium]|nr:hypothetical protein [Clostridia bacterium]
TQDDLEYFFTLKPVLCDGKVEFEIQDDNGSTSAPYRVFDDTFDYKSTIHLTINFDGFDVSDSLTFGLYENNKPLIRTSLGQEKLSYTFRKVTSDKEIVLKVLDPTGNTLYYFGQDFTIKFIMYIKDGFFDQFIAFFREIFGLLPEYNWEYGYVEPENQ